MKYKLNEKIIFFNPFLPIFNAQYDSENNKSSDILNKTKIQFELETKYSK
jgi:hypothetical protein